MNIYSEIREGRNALSFILLTLSLRIVGTQIVSLVRSYYYTNIRITITFICKSKIKCQVLSSQGGAHYNVDINELLF